jgi:hypothetical protein
MPGGGSNPGERRGGRPLGSRNKATIRREIIEKAALERQIDARAIAPIQGKLTLERLLGLALKHLDAAIESGDKTEFAVCFERVLSAAKEVTKYQSPQLKALAVAHSDMRPPPIDLDKLTAKQVQQLRKLLVLAGPSNVASARAQPGGNGRLNGSKTRTRP